MNRKDAEKLADEIFDMIDRNHPRGLIKSDLVDLLAKAEPAVQEALPFPPKPDVDHWITLEAALSEVEIKIDSLLNGEFADMTKDDHWTEEVMERLHEVNRHFGKDLCGNEVSEQRRELGFDDMIKHWNAQKKASLCGND